MNRYPFILFDEHLLGFIDADRFQEAGTEAGPQAGIAERLVGRILEPHVLRQHERLFVVRGDGSVVEALGQIAQQVTDSHSGRAGTARTHIPDECGFIRWVTDGEDLHIQRRLSDRGHDAKDDRVRINLGIGPREVDLVLAFNERHDPFFLDERGAGVIELDFDPFADRERNQFDSCQMRQAWTRRSRL